MRKPLFTGVCTALVTPFLGESINDPMLNVLLRRQAEAGVEAVVLAGTTGESATLSTAEKAALFAKGKEFAGNDLKIIAGTGSNNTQHAIELSLIAEQTGADGLLVVSPYYNKATPDGLVAHYRALAEAVSLPVILYNVPGRTGVDIPVSVYAKLAEIPNIIGVKEASSDIEKFLRIRTQCPDDFFLWCGNDSMTVPALSLGAKGVISVLSNLLPQQMCMMAYSALEGDFETAAALQRKLLPWTDFLFKEVNPIPIKAAMAEAGYDCGIGRLPLTPLSQENQALLRKLLS
ncbi:MAG: 4-hydroxy-tetrahydrodipicolinate synthase [Ruminococcaceae bacterium]|nr:4-hydroxy-tetrahydrodipicolinate synthase [Oscillospiraceae bacterium]